MIQQEAPEELEWIDQLSYTHGALWLLAGGLLVAFWAHRFAHVAELGIDDEERSLGQWRGREVLELCASGLALQIFLQWLIWEPIESDSAGMILFNAAWMVGLGGIAVGLAWQSDGAQGMRALGVFSSPRQITGERRRGSLGFVLLGMLSYLLWAPFLLGVYVCWPLIAESFGVVMEQQEILEQILQLEGAELFIAVLLASLVGPLLEELVFRGFLQPVLVRSIGALGGIVATSLLFAMLHGALVFLPIFILSLLLGWVQLRTRCLWASWATHALHNSLILCLSLVN